MSKHTLVLLFVLVLFAINNFSQSNNGSVLLYSQADLSTDFTSLPSYKNTTPSWEQVADDFSVSSDWSIDQIVVVCDYIDKSLIDGFNLYIYADNNKTPGELVYSTETQLYSFLWLNYFACQITISLENPVELNTGDYWISVQSHSSSDLDSLGWYWTQVKGSYGKIANFRNFSLYCASWSPLGHCLSTSYTDMYFELYGAESTVPVELTSFSAAVQEASVELNWNTSTEKNNQGFEIQREINGEFKTIGFVKGKGTTTESQTYSYTDKNLDAGNYNYRLKQLDYDGNFTYSKIIEIEVIAPSIFSLEQNYPNPFNPSTKISWQSPVASWQTLKVYDVLGNEVATLVDEYKQGGSYEVNFDASGLSSGIYFYTLNTGSNTQTKKLILMK
jgi:hypothetical protein